MEHCRGHIAKYALPYEIEFRTELPKTIVGKIAYTVLEKEEEEKMATAAAAEAEKEKAAELAKLQKAGEKAEKKAAKK